MKKIIIPAERLRYCDWGFEFQYKGDYHTLISGSHFGGVRAFGFFLQCDWEVAVNSSEYATAVINHIKGTITHVDRIYKRYGTVYVVFNLLSTPILCDPYPNKERYDVTV